MRRLNARGIGTGRATALSAVATFKRFGFETSGQAIIESILLMIPLLVLVFNAINIGYLLNVLVNITGTPRTGALYCIMGSASPLNTNLPATGPGSTINTVSYLAYQDMGEVYNGPYSAGTTAVWACSSINV